VVDENGKLVDTLSASDLRGSSLAGVWFRSKKTESNCDFPPKGCAEENLHSLTMPVREFLASHPRQRPAGGEILRCAPTDLVRMNHRYHSVALSSHLICLVRAPQLGSAIDKLVEAQVHRLWITDEGEKPVSVLSLTDVIRAVLG
jgi:hypothetical protein